MKISTIAALTLISVISVSCTAIKKEKETYKAAEANEKKPVNCATAEGDLRALESEKVHAGKMAGAGVLAVVPVSLIEGLVTGTEGKRIKIATGDYNKKLDEKIAQIKTTCNVQS